MKIEKAIETIKMENELMQFDPNTGEDYPIELQNQDNQDLYKANLVAISALEKQKNNGWIPVAERLPNRETGCLVWQKIDGHYKYNLWHYVTDFPSSVIAWQPLPSTYKEVE